MKTDGSKAWIAQSILKNGTNTLKVAQDIGLGMREYYLIDIDEKKTVILHALLEVWGTSAPAAIIVTTVICIKEAKRKKEQEENPNPSDEEPCESDKLVHDSEDEKEENNKKAENIAEHEKVVNTENLLGPDNEENQEN